MRRLPPTAGYSERGRVRGQGLNQAGPQSQTEGPRFLGNEKPLGEFLEEKYHNLTCFSTGSWINPIMVIV